jgi:hypothetical protein
MPTQPPERLASVEDLLGRWLGIPTEHFGQKGRGGRYLGRVTQRRGKESVWYKCEEREYHDHLDNVRRWVISDEEAKQAKGGKLGPSTASPSMVTATTSKTVSRIPAAVRAAHEARKSAAAAPAPAPKSTAPPERVVSADDLIGRWLGIPTDHFNVNSGGGRFLGQVTLKKSKVLVWYKVPCKEGMEFYDHVDNVCKWLISDEEATNGTVEWYEETSDDEVEEEAEEEAEEEVVRPQARDPKAGKCSRAAGPQAKRARPNTARQPVAEASHDQDFGADFDYGAELAEAGEKRPRDGEREASGRQARLEARQDGWKGKPISKGADGSLFYTQLRIDGENFHVGDTVFVRGEADSEPDEAAPSRAWVCRIDSFWESTSGERCFEGRWYYSPEETCAGRLQGHDTREIFQTEHCTEQQPVEAIDGQCDVLSWDVYQEWLDQPVGCDDEHTYVCRASYHPGTGEFRPPRSSAPAAWPRWCASAPAAATRTTSRARRPRCPHPRATAGRGSRPSPRRRSGSRRAPRRSACRAARRSWRR